MRKPPVNLHDARILNAAGVLAVHARFEDRFGRGALEVEAVLARREAEADDMLGVVAGAAIEHVKRALVVNDAGIADDETFPRLLGIGREDGIAGIFFEFQRRPADDAAGGRRSV